MHRKSLPVLVHIFLTIFITSITFISCADTQPSVQAVYPRVVLDFETTTSLPTTFLSIYAELTSEPARLESISISQVGGNLIWHTNDIITVYGADNKKKYSGFSSFYMVKDQYFKPGKYTVQFEDMAERVDSYIFTIYDSDKNLPTNISENSATFLVCDSEDAILFSGRKNSDFISDSTLLRKYPTAEYYRQYYQNNSNHTVYLFPNITIIKVDQ